MDAKKLIEQVDKNVKENWANISLGLVSAYQLEEMANHFKTCEICSKAFDKQAYPEKTLSAFEKHLFEKDLTFWICDCKGV